VAELAGGAGCMVVVLAPRRGDGATLCRLPSAIGPGAACALPVVAVGAEPDMEEVVGGVSELVGEPVTLLRANAAAWGSGFDVTALIAEVGPLSGEPDGFCWVLLSDRDIEAIDPAWARASMRSWARERMAGWSDLRPQWSRPGWLAEAAQWMREQMAVTGYRDPEVPRIRHLWGISVVLSAASGTGSAFLKCSGDRFRHEGRMTQALAGRSQGYLPDVLAVEPERGWLLMRDLDAPLLGDQPESMWVLGLDALAGLQQEWLGRTGDLLAAGAELRPLCQLADWVKGTALDAGFMDRVAPQVRGAWLESVPAMVEACTSLDRIGPGTSLVHGDFHPWNVVAGQGGPRIFDWTDAAVAHPFLDLVTYVMRTGDLALRRYLLQRYLGLWSRYLSSDDLQAAGQLALVAGALYQARSYSQLIPTVMPDDLAQLRDGDVHWLQRALDRLDHGIQGAG
jgi:Phosphotransferase enzyme family